MSRLMDSDDLKQLIRWALSGIISFLMMGNLFFIKRLVDRVDAQTDIVWQLRQDVVVLKTVYEENRKAWDYYRKLKGE